MPRICSWINAGSLSELPAVWWGSLRRRIAICHCQKVTKCRLGPKSSAWSAPMVDVDIDLLLGWCAIAAGDKLRQARWLASGGKRFEDLTNSLLAADSGLTMARCMRLRATAPNGVWSYDFVFIREAYGGKIQMLTMIDEYSRKRQRFMR